MKLLITDDSIRHRYFVLKILQKFSDVFWIHGHRNRLQYYQISNQDEMIQHFKDLAETEKFFFETDVCTQTEILLQRRLGTFHENEINSYKFFKFIKNLNPECIITYSIPIITSDLLNLNIWGVHAGLLPYYKGSTTNIMPIVHNKPEYIGMTIFKLSRLIDEGKVILQRRPAICSLDDSHAIGCKNTILASKMVIELFTYLNSGKTIISLDQKEISSEGATYYKKDFNLQNLRKMNYNIKNGIFRNYKDKQINIKTEI